MTTLNRTNEKERLTSVNGSIPCSAGVLLRAKAIGRSRSPEPSGIVRYGAVYGAFMQMNIRYFLRLPTN